MVLRVRGKMGSDAGPAGYESLRGRWFQKIRLTPCCRFSEASQREELEVWGATTIAADLFDEVLNELPSCWNVVYRIGSKFGAVGNESGDLG